MLRQGSKPSDHFEWANARKFPEEYHDCGAKYGNRRDNGAAIDQSRCHTVIPTLYRPPQVGPGVHDIDRGAREGVIPAESESA